MTDTNFTMDEHKIPKDAVGKLIRMWQLAVPARLETAALKSEELSKRVKYADTILKSGEGYEAFQRSKVALRGSLPTAEFVLDMAGAQMTKDDVNSLYGSIQNADLPYFTKLNTANALTKILNGQLPTDGELKLLENMFGSELAKVLLDMRPLSKKIWTEILGILNFPRAVLASFDLSAPLRQGAVLFYGQYGQSLPALVPMLKAFASERVSVETNALIRSSKYAELRENAGLYIAPIGDKESTTLNEREEAFMSRWADKIPGIKQSQRAYVTYLNKLRADVFDYYANIWEGAGRTMVDYKALAEFINNATGRGSLKGIEGVRPILNAAFFSPGLQIGRIKTPFSLFSESKAVRKIAAKNIVSFFSANLVILSLYMLAGADVEDDPRSSDFGKIRFGNVRLDFWAGFQQYARAITQVITAERKTTTTGKIVELKREDVIEAFVRSKLSPGIGFFVDLIYGETMIGQEMTLDSDDVKEQAWNRLVPLFLQDMIEAIDEFGLGGAFLAFPGLFGAGVQAYGADTWTRYSDKLGEMQDDGSTYSTKALYGEISKATSGVRADDLAKLQGVTPIVVSIATARDLMADIPDTALYKINADISEGDTYETLYKNGVITRQEYALLKEYHALPPSQQKAFITKHPELNASKLDQHLASNPKDNALLALWGRANVMSKEAYKEVFNLANELDIPLNSLTHIPPEIFIDAYLSYYGTSSTSSKNTIRQKNPQLDAWGNVNLGWTVTHSTQAGIYLDNYYKNGEWDWERGADYTQPPMNAIPIEYTKAELEPPRAANNTPLKNAKWFADDGGGSNEGEWSGTLDEFIQREYPDYTPYEFPSETENPETGENDYAPLLTAKAAKAELRGLGFDPWEANALADRFYSNDPNLTKSMNWIVVDTKTEQVFYINTIDRMVDYFRWLNSTGELDRRKIRDQIGLFWPFQNIRTREV